MPPTKSEPPFDVQVAHRWFAVQLNNLAWDLVEEKHLSQTRLERLIHAAHAACFHWLEAGNLLNHLRAQCLLATAYAKAGLSEPAIRHAEKCLALSLAAGDSQTAFDRATAHGCASTAFALAGQRERAKTEYTAAKSAADALGDAADRDVLHKFYPAP